MARVGVDLDGVLFNFSDSLANYLIKYKGWRVDWVSSPERWEFYEDWGLSLTGFLNVCNEAADAGELWAGPFWGCDWDVQGKMNELRKAGHSVHIVTHRGFGSHPGVSAAATATWLRLNKIPYDTLTFSGDKTIIRTDYFIEDNVDNYVALEKSGCISVLIDRAWNKSLVAARRVPNVQRFVDFVLDEEAA